MERNVNLWPKSVEIVQEYRRVNDLPNLDVALNNLVAEYARLKSDEWMAQQFKAQQVQAQSETG